MVKNSILAIFVAGAVLLSAPSAFATGVGEAVGTVVGDTVGGNVGTAVGGSVGGSVGTAVGGPVGGSVGTAVGGSVGGSVGGNIGGTIGGTIGSQFDYSNEITKIISTVTATINSLSPIALAAILISLSPFGCKLTFHHLRSILSDS